MGGDVERRAAAVSHKKVRFELAKGYRPTTSIKGPLASCDSGDRGDRFTVQGQGTDVLESVPDRYGGQSFGASSIRLRAGRTSGTTRRAWQ